MTPGLRELAHPSLSMTPKLQNVQAVEDTAPTQVMRKVPGERLAEVICRKFYNNQARLRVEIFTSKVARLRVSVNGGTSRPASRTCDIQHLSSQAVQDW